jgi:nucleotide-binding universal stress UspA family protein
MLSQKPEQAMIAIKNVLVPTDFGEAALSALEYGRNIARTFGATLHVVYVVDNLAARVSLDYPHPLNLARMQTEMETEALMRLEALVSDDDRRTLHAKCVRLTAMSPAPAIMAYAIDAAIDIIVMGTHGRGRMAQLLMGSVAERIVRSAPCPVLVVRQPEREFIAPDALQTVAHV